MAFDRARAGRRGQSVCPPKRVWSAGKPCKQRKRTASTGESRENQVPPPVQQCSRKTFFARIDPNQYDPTNAGWSGTVASPAVAASEGTPSVNSRIAEGDRLRVASRPFCVSTTRTLNDTPVAAPGGIGHLPLLPKYPSTRVVPRHRLGQQYISKGGHLN